LDNTKKENPCEVLKMQLVTIGYKSTTGNKERLELRRIENKTTFQRAIENAIKT